MKKKNLITFHLEESERVYYHNQHSGGPFMVFGDRYKHNSINITGIKITLPKITINDGSNTYNFSDIFRVPKWNSNPYITGMSDFIVTLDEGEIIFIWSINIYLKDDYKDDGIFIKVDAYNDPAGKLDIEYFSSEHNYELSEDDLGAVLGSEEHPHYKHCGSRITLDIFANKKNFNEIKKAILKNKKNLKENEKYFNNPFKNKKTNISKLIIDLDIEEPWSPIGPVYFDNNGEEIIKKDILEKGEDPIGFGFPIKSIKFS